MHNKSMESSCRDLHPLVVLGNFGPLAHARAIGSAAVAHFNRSPRLPKVVDCVSVDKSVLFFRHEAAGN